MHKTSLRNGLLPFLLWSMHASAECELQEIRELPAANRPCSAMETVTIFGVAQDVRDVAGGASTVDAGDLQEFASTDVVRSLRRVPGVSFQPEDGFGLRPNISIRGTPTERSSRITLLEDGVLIAPAPYAAPAAYYFPTFGRIHSMEVLKGPAAITQGPYTIGGALNLISTPIPDRRAGMLRAESGADAARRVHAWYGDSQARSGWLVETHQWQSDGFQHVDRSKAGTGLDKQDYLAKLRFSTDPASDRPQELELKLQASAEDSNQTYLGLTDADFGRDPLRRYGLSGLDHMHNEHEQVTARWRVELAGARHLSLTAYHHQFERAWYKTEGIDFDGSEEAGSFHRTGWAAVIDAVNQGFGLGGLGVAELQEILDGGDTPPGSVLIRNNARSYDSRGLQAQFSAGAETANSTHQLQIGLRYHEDAEDRLQRNDTFRQSGGKLVLSAAGREGDAGNRVQKAEAWSAYVHDRIESGRWVWTPGIRLESIRQSRVDYGADPSTPHGRQASDIRRIRDNRERVWIPGIGMLYRLNESAMLVAGVHRGFSAPGNREGIEPERSFNYEAGFRLVRGDFEFEAMAFFNDYENLQGICTASSGSDCEVGDVFNGNAVRVPGLELQMRHDLSRSPQFRIPVLVSYAWMNAEFQSDIADSEFFGDVARGDPVPYIPEHQAFVSFGVEMGDWSGYLSANYTDGVCTEAGCGAFARTDSSLILDLGVHYQITGNLELYAVAENLTAELNIESRQPYGARPGKDRTWLLGARLDF